MDLNKGIIVNKYGAVDVSVIVEMQKEINELHNGIKYYRILLDDYKKVFVLIYSELFGIDINMDNDWDFENILAYKNGIFCTQEQPIVDIFKSNIKSNLSVLKKLRELTNADDYEFQTTPATTKLVKKDIKDK